MNLKHPRYLVLATIILAAAGSRLLPHPPNFTPVGAMALFGGAHFARRSLAYAVPLITLALGDLVLGFHILIPFVYGAFSLTVALGALLRQHRTPWRVSGVALLSSVLFFLITNFGVWLQLHTYPQNLAGLLACYVAGIPFFAHTVLGDAFFTALLFGGFALAERRFVSLREPIPQAAHA
jgi:hypothetical protein